VERDQESLNTALMVIVKGVDYERVVETPHQEMVRRLRKMESVAGGADV
jgi:hypothetical protein